MQVVREILDSKGGAYWSVAPDTTVCDAIKLMADKEVGSVLVVADGGVTGILTERDYARKIAHDCRASLDMPVSQIMTSPVLCTRPEQSIEECMALMTEKRVRHLPVLDDGRIVGIVSIGDLVKAVISTQQFIIAQLEHYIAG